MGISPSCGGGGRGAACLLLRKIFTAVYVTAWACFLEASDLCISYLDFMLYEEQLQSFQLAFLFAKPQYYSNSLMPCLLQIDAFFMDHRCSALLVSNFPTCPKMFAASTLLRQYGILNNYRYPVLYRVYCKHMNTNIYKNIFLSELQTLQYILS